MILAVNAILKVVVNNSEAVYSGARQVAIKLCTPSGAIRGEKGIHLVNSTVDADSKANYRSVSTIPFTAARYDKQTPIMP